MVGSVHTQCPPVSYRSIGTVETPQGTATLATVDPLGEPMVVLEDGRTFVLSWDDIVSLAQDALTRAEPVQQVSQNDGTY